jgi:hypothetical protein
MPLQFFRLLSFLFSHPSVSFFPHNPFHHFVSDSENTRKRNRHYTRKQGKDKDFSCLKQECLPVQRLVFFLLSGRESNPL